MRVLLEHFPDPAPTGSPYTFAIKPHQRESAVMDRSLLSLVYFAEASASHADPRPEPGLVLALWLFGALIIHDGLLSPAVLGVGAALRRYVPDRGRRYLQFGLIMAAMVTVIAVPMIYRANREPPSKALLLQDFSTNLTVLLAVLGGVTLVAYAIRVARDRSMASRPPLDEAHK